MITQILAELLGLMTHAVNNNQWSRVLAINDYKTAAWKYDRMEM